MTETAQSSKETKARSIQTYNLFSDSIEVIDAIFRMYEELGKKGFGKNDKQKKQKIIHNALRALYANTLVELDFKRKRRES